MHHQIPTSSRDGGDQTLQTTADVLRCEAQIETWGVWFMHGGWGCVSPPRYELSVCLLHGSLFDTFPGAAPPRQNHSPCPWHPRLSHHKASLAAEGGVRELHIPQTQDPWWVPTTASNTQICFLNIAGLAQSHGHVIPEVQATVKEKKTHFGLCSGETETPLKSSPGDCQDHLSYFNDSLLSAAVVRPAVPSAPENRHMCKERGADGTQRGKRTLRLEPQTSLTEWCGAPKWKQVTGNSKQQSKKGKMFETYCSNCFLWMAQRSPHGFWRSDVASH